MSFNLSESQVINVIENGNQKNLQVFEAVNYK